jgi:16S rRNA (cytidine1402-2'-O)-methyltransferase
MRALRVLREVDLVAAEDTRRTARLLQHYSIATPTTSLHEHNEHGKSPRLVAKLEGGTSIALVSDAGMPLISDPGATLVRAARAAGIPIQVVPGPSAVTAALAAAGISGPFTFLGFPPASGQARQGWIKQLGQTTTVMPGVFFESPHRIDRTIADLKPVLGNRPITVARELTKLHEQLVEQPIIDWLAGRQTPQTSKGEHVVIVAPRADAEKSLEARPKDEVILDEIGRMTEVDGVRPREAAKVLAERYGMSTSEVYALHARRNK